MSDSPSVTPTSYALVGVGALSYTCLLFLWFSLPAYLSTIIAETGITGTQAGVLAGAIPLTYVPLALFSGLVVDLEEFSGADLASLATEAGMFAIRDGRTEVTRADFADAVEKLDSAEEAADRNIHYQY